MSGANPTSANVESNSLSCGVYRHYKGNEYLVLGVARHSETDEPFVVYARLYSRDGFPLTVRPLRDFTASVTLDDGQTMPRFCYLGLAQATRASSEGTK